MTLVSCLMLGLAMSTDAFAAALARGAGMIKPRLKDALGIGLIFGVVEALTPVIGWALGSMAARLIQDIDHWVAFALLVGLGVHMIYRALHHGDESADEDGGEGVPARRGLLAIALTGLATSIDAMAVGVGLAFVEVNILVVAGLIGLCTFVMVTLGILAGRALGSMAGKRAELLGGIVLIVIGCSILYSHLNALPAAR